MDLQLLFKALWRRRWVLVLVPLMTVVSTVLIQFLGVWKFKSSAQLATGITINDELIDQGTRFNPYEIQISFTNLIEMIKSRDVLNQVSFQLLHHDLSTDERPFREPSKEKFSEILNIDFDEHIDEFTHLLAEKIDSQKSLTPTVPIQKNLEAVIKIYEYDYESILDNLEINRVSNSDYVELSFVSENKFLSAYVVNTICSEFIRFYSSVRASRSSVSLESLTSIVEQRRKYFEEKVEELKNFRSKSNVIDPNLESESKIRQIHRYEDEIAAEQLRMRGLELTLASIKMRLKEAEEGSSLEANDQIVTLRKKINRLNEEYILGGQQNQILLDSITLLRDQLQGTLNRLNDARRATPAELNAMRDKRDQAQIDLEISRENLSSLRNVLESIRFGVGKYSNQEAIASALEKEVEVARTEYLAAQNRYTEAKDKLITKRMSIYQAVMGEPAEKAESRKTIIFVIFSGIISFSLCVLVIVLLELADTTIRTPQRLKQISKINTAGVLHLQSKAVIRSGWILFEKSNGKANEIIQLKQDIGKIRYEVEASGSRVILVTSTQKAQGKSFFIMSLAYSLSLIHKRVLVIDTNFRNNSLTELMTAKGNISLVVDFHKHQIKKLSSGSDQSDKDQKNDYYESNLITKTRNQLIDIVGSHISPFSPSELIPGRDFNILLEWLKVQYDYIILEGASLNEYSDSRELVKFSDLVIPVFAADSHLSADDKNSLIFLRSLQKLGPAVLNKYWPQ